MTKISDAVKMLEESKYVTVITGAGISTNAGIPDYRSNEGLYNKDKKELFTREFFENNKKEFFNIVNGLIGNIEQQSKAHYILVEWLEKGIVKKILRI